MNDANRHEEEARRQWAQRDLEEQLAAGHDPHTACCMVIYEILHVDADVVAGDYVGSFVEWVFDGDAAERERWRAMVGANFNEGQKTHDFNKEGF